MIRISIGEPHLGSPLNFSRLKASKYPGSSPTLPHGPPIPYCSPIVHAFLATSLITSSHIPRVSYWHCSPWGPFTVDRADCGAIFVELAGIGYCSDTPMSYNIVGRPLIILIIDQMVPWTVPIRKCYLFQFLFNSNCCLFLSVFSPYSSTTWLLAKDLWLEMDVGYQSSKQCGAHCSWIRKNKNLGPHLHICTSPLS